MLHVNACHPLCPRASLLGHCAMGGVQNAPRWQRMPHIHDRMLSVSCSAFVVQVRENVRGASLEGKALKTEQGLKVRPAVASSSERMCGVPLLFSIHSWVTGL